MALDAARFIVSAGITGVQSVQTGASAISTSLTRMQAQLASYALALGAIYKVSDFFAETVRAADALNDLVDSTGSAVGQLSALSNTARVSGVGFDEFRTMMNRLSVGIAGVGEEGGKASKALEALGVESRDPAQAMVELATSLDRYADGADKAALVTAIFGRNGAAMLPFLKDLAQDGLEAATVTAQMAAESEKLGKDWERTKIQLEGAATSIAGYLVPAINGAIEDLKKGTKEAGGFWSALLQFGLTNPFKDITTRQREVREEIEKANKAFYQLANDGAGEGTLGVVEKRIGRLKAELSQLNREQLRSLQMLTGPSTYDARDYQRLAKPNAPKSDEEDKAKKTKSAVVDLTKSYETLERQLLENVMAAANLGEVERLQLKLSTGELAKLSAAQKERLVGIAKTLEAMRAEAAAAKAVAQEEGELAALRAEMAAIAERAVKAADQQTLTMIAQLDQLKAEGEEIGKTKEQLDQLTLSRLDAQIATLATAAAARESVTGMDAETAAMYVQLQVLRQIRAQAASNQTARSIVAANEAIVEQAQKAEEEWRRTSDTIERSLTDALMRGFESGADFAQNFRDTLVNLFKTLILRPVIQAIVSPVAAGMAGLMPGGASAGPLGGGGFGGILQQGSSLFGGSSSTLGYGGLSGLLSGSGGIFGAGAIGNSFALGSMGQALGLSAAGLEMAGGVALTSLGTALGTAIPILGAALAVATMLGAFDKDPDKTKGQYFISPGASGFEDNQFTKTPFGNIGFFDANTQQFDGAGAQVFNEVVAGTLQAFADRMNDDQIAALSTRLQGLKFGEMEDEYTTEDWLKKFGAEILDKVISESFAVLDPKLQAVFDAFDGTADEMAEFANVLLTVHDLTEALPTDLRDTLISALDGTKEVSEQVVAFATAYGTLQEVMNRDPVEDALDALARAGASAYESLQMTADAFEELIEAYDGSAEASMEIAEATAAYYNQLVQVIAGIRQLGRSIDEMFGGTIEDLTLQTLDDAGKRKYYQDQIALLYGQLGTATDPAEIERITKQINEYMRAAFGLLTPDEQVSLLAQYTDFARQVNEIAQERLLVAEAAAQRQADQLFTQLRDIMLKAADDMAAAAADHRQAAADHRQAAADQRAAAATQLVAANTPIVVTVDDPTVNG